MTWAPLLCLGALLSAATGCMSAETSEASQLTRLEHGIDVSTTPPDRFTSRGELPGDGKLEGAVPPAAQPPATSPVTAPSDAPSVAIAETTDDTAPRPTIRIWGSKIVYDASADPPGPVR
jgi:hypothetical protein